MNAVAGDEDRPLLRRQALAGGIDKFRPDELAGLGHRRAAPAEIEALPSEPLLHGLEQDALQVAAMQRKLRVRMAGMLARRFAVDELAEAVEEDGLPGDDRALGKRIHEIERGKLGHRVR